MEVVSKAMALWARDSAGESRATRPLLGERQKTRDSAAPQDGYKKQNKQGIYPGLILESWLCGLYSNQQQDSICHLEMDCLNKRTITWLHYPQQILCC